MATEQPLNHDRLFATAAYKAWVERVCQAMEPLLPKDFVGRVELNVFMGSIANINIAQSLK